MTEKTAMAPWNGPNNNKKDGSADEAGGIVMSRYPHSLSLPAVDSNGSVLAELLLCFMNLAYEVDESLARLWDALFWPISEVELSYCSRLAVLHTQQPITARGCNGLHM